MGFKNTIEYEEMKEKISIENLAYLIKRIFLRENRLARRAIDNKKKKKNFLRNLVQLQICKLEYIGEYTKKIIEYCTVTGKFTDPDILDRYLQKLKNWDKWTKTENYKTNLALG